MKKYIIPILFVSVMLGYAREAMPISDNVGFPFNDLRINGQWYWFILFKDLRSVLLVWLAWSLIPKNNTILRLGASIFAVMITLVPINFVLFYSAPFHIIAFIVKLIASIIVGFLITYLNDRTGSDNDSSNV